MRYVYCYPYLFLLHTFLVIAKWYDLICERATFIIDNIIGFLLWLYPLSAHYQSGGKYLPARTLHNKKGAIVDTGWLFWIALLTFLPTSNLLPKCKVLHWAVLKFILLFLIALACQVLSESQYCSIAIPNFRSFTNIIIFSSS